MDMCCTWNVARVWHRSDGRLDRRRWMRQTCPLSIARREPHTAATASLEVYIYTCIYISIYICFCVEERELNNQKTQIQPKSIPSRLKKEQQYFWVWVLKCFEHSLCQVLTDEVFAQPSVSSEEMWRGSTSPCRDVYVLFCCFCSLFLMPLHTNPSETAACDGIWSRHLLCSLTRGFPTKASTYCRSVCVTRARACWV